jgi:hypothetical protein
VYVPSIGKVVGPTAQISFVEDIPSHNESYLSKLHQHDNVIDTTDPKNPLISSDDFTLSYWYNTYIDDEDGCTYIRDNTG